MLAVRVGCTGHVVLCCHPTTTGYYCTVPYDGWQLAGHVRLLSGQHAVHTCMMMSAISLHLISRV